MAGADPEHVATRLSVAQSIIHPIRTYTTGRSKTGGDGSATTPSRPSNSNAASNDGSTRTTLRASPLDHLLVCGCAEQ